MQLSDVAARLRAYRLTGLGRVDITGITHDSRKAGTGDLFVAFRGEHADGHRFVADAIRNGASAVMVEEGRLADAVGVPVLEVPDTRVALAWAAAAVYGDPSAAMRVFGVGGTNGKTSSVQMISAITQASGLASGTIGTLGAEFMGRPLESERTTPQADQLQRLLASMHAAGCRSVAMEVSSHALDQHRADAIHYDGAIYTNLQSDHLDYHGDLDTYFEAKLRLYTDLAAASQKPFVSAVNLDDPRGVEVARRAVGQVVTFGASPSADVRASAVELGVAETRFRIDGRFGGFHVVVGCGGAFQAENATGVIALTAACGIPTEAILEGLRTLRGVPGRFESVPTGRGFGLVVDYAHTEAGLLALLQGARRLSPRRIILVFGAGGDRDTSKRAPMGRAAAQWADVAIVTSDNPRTESPASIIRQVLEGTAGGTATVIAEPDRRAAIRTAIEKAIDGDLVIIAGKGHETTQTINGVEYPFDDRVVAREILAETGE